jgi:hypothetical protein
MCPLWDPASIGSVQRVELDDFFHPVRFNEEYDHRFG